MKNVLFWFRTKLMQEIPIYDTKLEKANGNKLYHCQRKK